MVTSQEDGTGGGIPPQFFVKSHLAQFLVNSPCFIPCAEFLGGVRMWHLGRKCLGAGFSPALPRDVTGAKQKRTLGRAWGGAKDLVLLSYSPWPFVWVTC